MTFILFSCFVQNNSRHLHIMSVSKLLYNLEMYRIIIIIIIILILTSIIAYHHILQNYYQSVSHNFHHWDNCLFLTCHRHWRHRHYWHHLWPFAKFLHNSLRYQWNHHQEEHHWIIIIMYSSRFIIITDIRILDHRQYHHHHHRLNQNHH